MVYVADGISLEEVCIYSACRLSWLVLSLEFPCVWRLLRLRRVPTTAERTPNSNAHRDPLVLVFVRRAQVSAVDEQSADTDRCGLSPEKNDSLDDMLIFCNLNIYHLVFITIFMKDSTTVRDTQIR